MPGSLLAQTLSMSSLVYLLVWHPPLHTAYISSQKYQCSNLLCCSTKQKQTKVTLTSSKYGTKSRGLMKSAMLRVLTQALADDWPPTATESDQIMCDGGMLTRPRLMAHVRTSLSLGRTWSVRMCGSTSERMSRSSTSLRSRFLTPLRLMLCAV